MAVFNLILQGFGISLISGFGMVTSVLHCIKFWKLERKTIFDCLLLMCIVYSFICLIFTFLLVSLSAFLDHQEIHSNSHMTFLPFFMFGDYVGTEGSVYSLILLLFERYSVLHFKHLHDKMNITWISIFLGLQCVIFGILHTIEYELMCYEDGEPHENIFSICPDDEKAYITYSSLRSATGYKYFTTVMMFINSLLIPAFSVIFFYCQLIFRRSLWTQPTIRRLFLACMFLTVSMLVWLVPFSYELHGLARSLSPWDFHYEMPTWILKFYEISYFFTILGPSFYPIIFNGKELLSFSSQKIQGDDNPLIDSMEEGSNNSRLETVSMGGE